MPRRASVPISNWPGPGGATPFLSIGVNRRLRGSLAQEVDGPEARGVVAVELTRREADCGRFSRFSPLPTPGSSFLGTERLGDFLPELGKGFFF